MATLIRTTAVWEGAPGLPGFTQFYSVLDTSEASDAQGAYNRVSEFFNALVALIPIGITVTLDGVYQVIDDASGQIIREGVIETPASATAGSYVSDWAGQLGVLVEWVTGAFVNGRRLRGRTYLVPLGASTATDGTLPEQTMTAVRAAAAWIGDPTADFRVWHRPVNGAGGSSSTITGFVVRDHAAVLRSRRV